MRLGGIFLIAAVLLLTLAAAGGEIPDAPSAIVLPERGVPLVREPLLPNFDIAEFAPAPIVNAAVFGPERPRPRRIIDAKFLLLAGISTGLTVADYEMTQSCLARHVCAEADPLLPHSRAGMYATNIPVNAAIFWWSYKRKAAGKRLWWLPPMAVIASHAIGVGTNVRFLK